MYFDFLGGFAAAAAGAFFFFGCSWAVALAAGFDLSGGA